jgi:hypothetical protein
MCPPPLQSTKILDHKTLNVHTLSVAAGLEHHAMVRSALVDMYGKSGSMSDGDVVVTDRTKLL